MANPLWLIASLMICWRKREPGGPGKDPGHETAVQGDGQGQRVQLPGWIAEGLGLGDLALGGGRRGLALGQGVDLVVVDEEGRC